MEKVNGDANIRAISESLNAGRNITFQDIKHLIYVIIGIPRFTYVSTVESNLPSFILKG